MLATLTTAVLLLQQQHEAALTGRVVDGSGRPAAKATVTLLHRPIPRYLDPANEHRVVVATDERGAFRAKLHDDADYSVWAATASGASDIAEGVSAGEFLELRIEEDTRPRSVDVAGLDAWSEAKTFRWRALVGGEHVDFVPVECRDGKLALPPLPPISMQTLEVLRADGEVLHAVCATGDEERGGVQLPPPASYTVHVVDGGGAPLADVEVLVHLRNYWATASCGVMWGDRFRSLWPSAGKTDANGRLTLRIADPGGNLWLLAKKDGYRMSLDGLRDGKRFRAGVELGAGAAAEASAPFDVVLERTPPRALWLRPAGSAPLAVDTVFVVSRVHVTQGTSGWGTPFPFALPVVDGNASLAAPLPPSGEVEIVWTVLAPAARAELQKALGFAPPALWRLPEPAGVLGDARPQLDPSAWRSLHVIAADGRPAAHAVVHLSERSGEMGSLVRTDRLGRVAFPVSGPLRLSAYSRDGAGSIEIDANSERSTTLPLRALAPLVGRVTNAGGAGVAGARVTLHLQRTNDGICVVDNLALSSTLSVRTANDGTFQLLAPPWAAAASVAADTPQEHGETRIDWDPASPPKVDVTLAPK